MNEISSAVVFLKNTLSWGCYGNFFHWYLRRNRYKVCVKSKNVMKSAQKKYKKYKKYFLRIQQYPVNTTHNSFHRTSFSYDHLQIKSWTLISFRPSVYLFADFQNQIFEGDVTSINDSKLCHSTCFGRRSRMSV